MMLPHLLLPSTLAFTLLLFISQTRILASALPTQIVAAPVKQTPARTDLPFVVVLDPDADYPSRALPHHDDNSAGGRWIGLDLPSQLADAIWMGSQQSWPRHGPAFLSQDQAVNDDDFLNVFRLREESRLDSWDLFATKESSRELESLLTTPRSEGGQWFWVGRQSSDLVLIGFDINGDEVGRSSTFSLAQLEPSTETGYSRPDTTPSPILSAWMDLLERVNLCFVFGMLLTGYGLMMLRREASVRGEKAHIDV